MLNIEEKLKGLPDASGVYIMYDAEGTVIYVGKAVVLKNRVRQYFYQSGNKTEKVMKMMQRVADFKYIITSSERDALALESNLIKKHWPQYNILLKDDKSHPYIKINMKADYPALEITRRIKSDGAKYFGPYFNGVRAKEIIELVKSAYPVRACAVKLGKTPKNHRECLNYHMHLCSAPCTGRVSKDEYRGIMEKAAAFLNGHDEVIEQTLREKMLAAAEREEFEYAARCRDHLAMVEKLRERTITALPKNINLDIFACASSGLHTVVSVFIVRGGKALGCDNFPVSDASLSQAQAVGEFISRYYGAKALPPPEIITAVRTEGEAALEQWLSEIAGGGHHIKFVVPVQGIRKQLLDTAAANAHDYLEKSLDEIKRKEDFTLGAVLQLQKLLNLAKTPNRIECFDISNISGIDKVASMVVFTGGEASKKDYRRFKIKTVEGADDFASMKEVLRRRLLHIATQGDSFPLAPDLIVVDGGKGQLSSARAAMTELGLDYAMIGLAKREEEIFTVGASEPVVLDKRCNALKLLQRVRDEAHRFAVTYHRKVRENNFKGQFKKNLKLKT